MIRQLSKRSPMIMNSSNSPFDVLAEALIKEGRRQFASATRTEQSLKTPVSCVYDETVDYRKKYLPINPISLTDRKNLFAGAMSMHKTSLIVDKSVKILPGLESFSWECVRFLRDLVKEMNREFPVSLDGDGFTDTGVFTNFDRLLCIAGCYQTPMSYTVVDNKEYRKHLGLRDGLNAREKLLFKDYCRIVLSHAKVSPVNVAKLSQAGMRRFQRDPQWKLDYAVYAMNNLEKILHLVERDDWVGLANEFEMVAATYIQKRGQVDSPGKRRESFSLDYALSGGLKGEIYDTDKRVFINGSEVEGFSAMRARVVHAGPWTVNCLLQSMFTPIMQSLFARFPKTFHVNTPDEIKSVIDGSHIMCTDITEYDRSIPRELIDSFHDCLSEVWDPRLVKLSRKLYTSAYFSRPLDKYGLTKPTWVGDPLSPKDQVFAGNRSGHGGTSVVAKLFKVFETICLVDRFYPLDGRIEDFLLGNLGFGTINNGDDEIFWSQDPHVFELFKKVRGDKDKGLFVAKPEDGQVYSGMTLMFADRDRLIYQPRPRIMSTLEKMWVPERSIGTAFRKYWFIGMEQRIRDLKSSDIGSSVLDVMMSVYNKHLFHICGSFTSMIDEGYSAMPIDYRGFNQHELMLLNNPDVVHYKDVQDKIGDEAMAVAFSKLPPTYVEKFMKYCYTGDLL